MNNIELKKGDTVIINSGVDKGKKGKILEVSPKDNKVVVEGVNIRTKHMKPRKAGEQGGIIKVESSINASKANVFCSKCGKPTRIAHKTEKDNKNRVCVKCGTKLD
jgi:ribosomal protein L24, bacterial/organelle